MKNKPVKEIVIYQNRSGKIEFRGDLNRDTVWGTQKQIADLFSIDRTVVTRHINKILKQGEVNEKSNVRFLHIANSDKPVKFYSLDIILAVGYRTNSSEAITFRKWASKTLKQHLLDGYTINKKRIGENYKKFSQAVEDLKKFSAKNTSLKTGDILELVTTFAGAWFSLEAYDKQTFPQKGFTRKDLKIQSEDLSNAP